MEEKNFKQVDILERAKPYCEEYNVKLTKSDLSQYLSGKVMPKQAKLFILSKALGVRSSWLLGYDNYEDDSSNKTDTFIKAFEKAYNGLSHTEKKAIHTFFKKVAFNIEETQSVPPTDTPPERISAPFKQSSKTIPYYYGLSAGTGIYHLGNDYSELIDIPNNPEYKHVTYAAKVNGDSMQPTFIDGETVLIARDITPLVGETGVFVIDGEMFIKERGKDRLISHNPKYEDIILSEYMNIVCEGNVIGKL